MGNNRTERHNKIRKLVEDSPKDMQDEMFYVLQCENINQRKEEIIGEIFNRGTPSCTMFKILDDLIKKAKKEAKKYYNSEIAVKENRFSYKKEIVIEYHETDEEVYNRIVERYNNLLNLRKTSIQEKYNDAKVKLDDYVKYVKETDGDADMRVIKQSINRYLKSLNE